MKIRSPEEFSHFIDHEYSWRRHELTNLRNNAFSAKKTIKTSLLRSFVPLLYAHWEGLIKQLSVAVLEYIVHRGFRYSELKSTFRAYAIAEYSRENPLKQFSACVSFLSEVDYSAAIKIDPHKYIDASSNLNAKVLKDFASKLGIDYSLYATKENFINETFVKLRNGICHGERIDVDESTCESLYREITELMQLFKNQIENHVSQESFLLEESRKFPSANNRRPSN